MNNDTKNLLFKGFIKSMNTVLDENLNTGSQKELLESLFKAERKFLNVLNSSSESRNVYMEFIRYIKEDKRNILSARVYFREKQEVFSEKISPCFKQNKPDTIGNFRINYHFAKWVCNNYHGSKYTKLKALLGEIIQIRHTLCENNIPLSINRAKIFWAKVPNSPVEYMDIIQAANEGLLTSIDKFVPPYKSVFRSVAIGRMTLNILTDHNATTVKLSPIDRRVLYRANNARIKGKFTEIKDILAYVQESFPKITEERLQSIMTAATGLSSMESPVNNDESITLKDVMPSEEKTPEEKIIMIENMTKLRKTLKTLPLMEMKVVRLKFGMDTGSKAS